MGIRQDVPDEDHGRDLLAKFNGLPAEAASHRLLACCSSGRWADAMAAGRPYASLADLLRQSDTAVAGLSPADLREALAGHPRIGERRAHGEHRADGEDPADGEDRWSRHDRWSRQEQAGVDEAAELTRRALADGNAAYEQRFGHIYLVCATGRSAGELLDLLRARLANDGETEWRVVRSELEKINQIRLHKLIGGET